MELPYSLEAEKQVLANMLFSKEILVETATRLNVEDFYDKKHQVIYETLLKMLEQNNVKIEPSSLIDTLVLNNNLEKAGDAEYIIELFDNFIDTANNKYYISSVEEKSVLRQLILFSNNVVNKWQTESAGDIVDYINKIEQTTLSITKKRKIEDFITMDKAIEFYSKRTNELKESGGNVKSTPSGIPTLDKMTMGFHPGELIIVAARPGGGKSAIALNMLVNAALKTRKNCVMFSLEMDVNSLTNRMLSLTSQVDSRSVMLGEFNKNQEMRVSKAMRDLQQAPIYIDETPGIKVLDMRAKLQKLQAAHGEIGLVVVDYIGIITPDTRSKDNNRAVELGKITGALKILARDFKVPVIALAQLNRNVSPSTNTKDGKKETKMRKPMLTDLRESGAIEQDADIVLFIHDENYGNTEVANDNNNPDSMTPIKLLIAKHRNGALGEIDLLFYKNYSKFHELDKKYSSGDM